ncbi:MAG: hypothetical protein CGW95_10350 [Phenylobacterium zucineum]|nr:MAG: hypothetical protein CGW95_10350 [Phenylobacterium zucineum]
MAGRLAPSSARLLTDGASRSIVTGVAASAAIGERFPTPSATETALRVSPAVAPVAQLSTDTCQVRPPPVIGPSVQESPDTVSADAGRAASASSALTVNSCDAKLLGLVGDAIVIVGALRSKVTVGEVAAVTGPVVPPNTESAMSVSVRFPSEQPDTVTK